MLNIFSGCKNISTLYLHDLGIWLNSQNFLPSQHLYIDGKEVTDIVIPNTVTSIGRVFENCEYVTSVHIPESVTEIENFAFSGCKALTSVNIPNSVTTIGENAFQVCSSLSSVTIPNSITKIDRRAFYGCKNLTEVHSLIENPFAISASTFLSYNSSTKSDYTTATLYVPKGTKSRYLSTEGWSNNFNAIEEMASGPESIKLPMMATVEVGKTITLEPEIKPDGATAVLTWESKDDKIALLWHHLPIDVYKELSHQGQGQFLCDDGAKNYAT